MVTVGFSTTRKFLSRVIRFVTRGVCSHAWVAFHDETLGTKLVAQAEVWGVELRPWALWSKQNVLVAEFSLDLPEGALLAALRKIPVGSEYDFAAGFWTGVAAWIRRWIGARFTFRPSRTPRQLMCAELQARYLRDAGIPLEGVDEEAVAPVELLELISAHPLARRIP